MSDWYSDLLCNLVSAQQSTIIIQKMPITNDITVFILGYRQDIGFSSLSISSMTEVNINQLSTTGVKINQLSTNCFFVVVRGKYLRLMDKVMDIVDNVTEDVGRRPLAVFYVTKDEKITTFYDQPFHLPLVINLKFIILHIYIKQLYFMQTFYNCEKFVQ